MKKIIFLILILINVVVFANNEDWRNLVIAQFREISEPLFNYGEATQPQFDIFYTDMVERYPTQMQAEKALEYAINRFDGASDYVLENAEIWKGQISNSTKLNTLIDLAVNSPLIEVRMAGFEMYLAENNFDKTEEQIDNILQRFQKAPEKNAGWAMWAIGAIAARGIDRDRVFDELIYTTTDPNPEIRRSAVNGLSRFGGEEVVLPLLEIAQYDSSPIIQERAFCGLAQTGTLNVAERYSALSGLLSIAQDPQSNQQTLDWTYQALKEISHIYTLADESDLWEKKLKSLNLVN
ncbi:hypothetical protein MNBD_BACTEROID05-106 [hydrothermal vent metagenome]|uniref:HEAT repeat domain-containing protein n=1 Tax=hydrothermal vent metagenome TaxID=652676 RepID=A0A3B0TYA0_9ZZZZ